MRTAPRPNGLEPVRREREAGYYTRGLKRCRIVREHEFLDTVSLTLCLSPPSAEFFDAEGNEVDLNFGGLRGRGVKKQDPPIERDLYLSLEDLFFGCTKKIKISRRVSTASLLLSALTRTGDLGYGLSREHGILDLGT